MIDTASALDYNRRLLEGFDHLGPADQVRFCDLIAWFQEAHGLGIDGKFGPATRAATDADMGAGVGPGNADPAPPARSHARVVDHARAATKEVVYYDLGAGGSVKDPYWPTWPWNALRKCDCSAFVDGMLGFARDSWNTAKQVADAVRFDRQTRQITGLGPETRFRCQAFIRQVGENAGKPVFMAWWRVSRGDKEAGTAVITFEPVEIGKVLSAVHPGQVIVHDGKYDPKTGVRLQPGHTGIVEHCAPGNGPWYESVGAIHCSPHNSQLAGEPGHAVALTDAAPWAREAMFLEYIPLLDG